eukprot:GHVS01072634.1.p1 GENE.GHVS01072634.1~~GHVS01072634.1.p1  ORF type:complete len:605 (-),score=70.05 GHVS01072634.1:583-2397(-)
MLPQRVAVFFPRSYGGSLRYLASSSASTPETSSELHSVASTPIYREASPSAATVEFDSSAFRSVSSSKLLGTLLIFSSCKIKPVVSRSEALLSLSKRVLGERFTHAVMKKTFFAHFCGGETADDLTGTIEGLSKRGIGSILDYAAEKDVSCSQAEADQHVCFEENLNCSIHAIRSSSQQAKGYAAVKLTSLCSPHLLLSSSALVSAAQGLFSLFSEHAAAMQQQKAHESPKSLRRSAFVNAAQEILNVSEQEAETVYSGIRCLGCSYLPNTLDGDSISIYGWTEYFSPNKLGRGNLCQWLPQTLPLKRCAASAQIGGQLKSLSDDEAKQWDLLSGRVNRLADCAGEYPNVRVMVDAEQTFLQPAIDFLVMREQHRSNGKRAVVYNTYQAYLKDTRSRLLADLRRSEDLKHTFGVKLVRGAYIVQEGELCKRHGYDYPINNDLASSHVSYDSCASILMDKLGQVELLMGTHNENSVLKAISLLQQKGFRPEDAPVAFAQLLGMCDHVSLSLGKSGYSAFKYVPYGPVGEVMPYLLRRAQENSCLLGSSTKEMGLIVQELRRRVVESPLFSRFAAAPATESTPQHTTSGSTSMSADSRDLKRELQK